MRSVLASLACASLCLCAVPTARAETVDLLQLPCRDVLVSGEQAALYVFWLDGYLSGEADDLIISQNNVIEMTKHVLGYCRKYPDRTLQEAGKDMPESGDNGGPDQEINMKTFKCSQFAALDPKGVTPVTYWIDGYASQQAEDTETDIEELPGAGTALVDYCSKHPRMTVLKAIEKLADESE